MSPAKSRYPVTQRCHALRPVDAQHLHIQRRRVFLGVKPVIFCIDNRCFVGGFFYHGITDMATAQSSAAFAGCMSVSPMALIS